MLKGPFEPSTKQRHLDAVSRLYEAAERQRGTDCLDRLLADLDFDAIEDVLAGFLAQIRNESAIKSVDRSRTWDSALLFVTDILRYGGSAAGTRAIAIQTRLQRLERLYSVLSPNPVRTSPLIRALPPVVIDDLYAIFDPTSNPSVHKAQGSSFGRVILPIVPSRLFDRTMIYTAVTRAIETVVLIGDPDFIGKAISGPPRAVSRTTGINLDRISAAGSCTEIWELDLLHPST